VSSATAGSSAVDAGRETLLATSKSRLHEGACPMIEACQLCGGRSMSRVISVPHANFSSRIKSFDILRCHTCELSTLQPFPTPADIEELYVKERVFSVRAPNPYQSYRLFKFLEPLYQKYGTDLRFIASQCLRLSRAERPRVLDIGCSVGRLLNAFHALDPSLELHGIDIDPDAREKAIPHVRDGIIIDDFLTREFDRKFDIITMRFVIEHLLDFRSYIEKALSVLEPGGILFVCSPDLDSAQARQLGAEWKLINDPKQKIGHLRWFNRKSAEVMAGQFGLHVEKCVNRGEMLYHLPLWLQNLLRRVLGTDPASGRFIRHYALRIFNATVFDGVLSHVLSYGDGLYIFMRKQPVGKLEDRK
jgi:SAM-dependent methyltransferase